MNYEQAVIEARRLGQVIDRAEATAEQAKWDRAKLTWEQCQPNGSISKLDWAQDIGVSRRAVTNWYSIWEQHGRALPRSRYAEAELIVTGKAEQIEEHGTGHAARIAAGIRNLPPERKAEFVRQAVAENPEVRKALVEDPELYQQISRAHTEHVVEQADRGGSGIGRREFGEGMRQARERAALLALSQVQEAIANLRVRFTPRAIAEECTERDIRTVPKDLADDIAYLQAIIDAIESRKQLEVVRSS